MAREPRPWYWAARRGYYATVGGERRRLADGPKGPESRNRAAVALRAWRAEHDRAGPGKADAPRAVAELVARFLADNEERVAQDDLAAETAVFYRHALGEFGRRFGRRPAESVEPFEVAEFLARPSWGPTRRAQVATAIKRLYRWARRQGLIRANPVADLVKPRARRREAIPTPGAAEAAIGACVAPEFGLYLLTLHQTGCRPGEARAVEAADVDWDKGLWRRKGKTTRATGRERVVVVPAGLLALLREQARRFPTGPLLRNTQGRPWTPNAVNCQVRALRARLNRAERRAAEAEGREPRVVAGRELVSYALRHRWATDALLAGVDAATVAVLLGHSSLKMLMERYQHLIDDTGHMRAAAERVRGSDK